ncbi:MAG: hypothetical protein Q8R08_01440, partial [bacterium]|nr:hypothetical protein [bacterium]
MNDKNFAPMLARGLIKQTIRILDYIKENSRGIITAEKFRQFQRLHQDYIEYHVPLKLTANYLPPGKRGIYFPLLEKARVFAEPV